VLWLQQAAAARLRGTPAPAEPGNGTNARVGPAATPDAETLRPPPLASPGRSAPTTPSVRPAPEDEGARPLRAARGFRAPCVLRTKRGAQLTPCPPCAGQARDSPVPATATPDSARHGRRGGLGLMLEGTTIAKVAPASPSALAGVQVCFVRSTPA
jgi:hypothetical protein